MAKVTVYLPDDLHKQVQKLLVPISPTCQQALEKEVSMRNGLAGGVERITVQMRDKHDERRWTVGFQGKWLVPDDPDASRTGEPGWDAGAYWGVALTAKGQIFVYTAHCNDGWEPEYAVYSSLDEALKSGYVPGDIVAMAAGELGEDIALELDI